jgi:hypothetical protein
MQARHPRRLHGGCDVHHMSTGKRDGSGGLRVMGLLTLCWTWAGLDEHQHPNHGQLATTLHVHCSLCRDQVGSRKHNCRRSRRPCV